MAVAYAETLEEALGDFEEECVAEQLGVPDKVIDCETEKEMYTEYVYGGG